MFVEKVNKDGKRQRGGKQVAVKKVLVGGDK